MSGISTIRNTGPMPATAVLKLSPQRAGLTGSAHLPSGEAVPIGDLLSTVLARYGLPEAGDEEALQRPDQTRGEMRFDVLA
jgi:hypothetical protein